MLVDVNKAKEMISIIAELREIKLKESERDDIFDIYMYIYSKCIELNRIISDKERIAIMSDAIDMIKF